MTPGFTRKLTILKTRDNQCLFLMEMFILRYANVLCIYPKHCLQVGFTSWLRTYLPNQYVIFRYCSPSEGDQPWDFFGGNDAEVETPVLWPPHVKS